MLSDDGVLTGPATPSFGELVLAAAGRGELVVQPRMGFADPARMRRGLLATKRAAGTTVGTVTVDSYTRTGDERAAARAVATGVDLNGYPLVTFGTDTTRAMLDGVVDPSFPVQVRHGTAAPQHLIRSLVAAGLHATEGGPVSYCLPYSRVPLPVAVANWAETCELLLAARRHGVEPHLESFGGCMMGQLCPPSMLVALSVLEGMFFRQHGMRSVSVSYAQQTSPAQDREAVLALRRLAGELLGDVEWHVVLYAYMGVYPTTPIGARRLLAAAAELAATAGADRLIVKTAAEAHRIPTIAENVAALELAAAVAAACGSSRPDPVVDSAEYAEARRIVEAVLELAEDVGTALIEGFRRGVLDVPYCLHADNRGEARTRIDADGRLRWSRAGSVPVLERPRGESASGIRSEDLLAALRYVQARYDAPAAAGDREPIAPAGLATGPVPRREARA